MLFRAFIETPSVRGEKYDYYGGVLVASLQFSSQTSTARTLAALTSQLTKRGRDQLAPPKGKQVEMLRVSASQPDSLND